MLVAVVSHPGNFPQNQVLAITALGKKNQNGFPNEISNTRDSHRAAAAKRMAIPYRETRLSSKGLDRFDAF
jgi:hypothetical protein